MHPDDALEILLNERAMERARAGRAPLPSGRLASDDLAPLLNAAARLEPLHDATPAAAFADDLEQRLLTRLGQRPATARRLRASRLAGFGSAPQRIAWTGIAAALLLSIGAGVLTAQAAPGEPLYTVRQFAQHAAAEVFPSPTDAATAALTHANADLATYDAEIARGDTSAALATLRSLHADDAQAAAEAAALGTANARQAALTQLAQFRRQAQSDLRASLPTLSWQGRAQVTDQLRSWGDTDLAVKQASVLADSSSAQNQHAGDKSALLVVSGAGFAPGAQALVNGQAIGTLISLTPTRILARFDASALNASNLVIVVENPDGTVAMTTQVERDDTGAPGTVATPGDGAHAGDHGGANGGGSNGAPSSGADATTTPDSAAGG